MKKLIVTFVSVLFVLVSTFSFAAMPDKAAPPANTLLQFTSGGHVMGFAPNKVYIAGIGHALTEKFINPNTVTPRPLSSDKVIYESLWKGISLTYEARKTGIAESIYTVHPGADVTQIQIKYNAEVTIEKNGTLTFNRPMPQGSYTMSAPIAWQEKEGRKVPIEVAFVTHSPNTIGFKTGPYDKALPLIIDPTYEWHTFYGSASADFANGIALDSSGNVYVTGYSDATWGSPLHDHSGLARNIFTMKLDNSGAYQWHAFYGSGNDSVGNAISVDNMGNLYIAGASVVTWAGPLGQNPLHAHSGDTAGDLFVLKLGSNGAYQWHTFYGATGSQAEAYDIAIHDNDFIVITGRTYGTWKGPSGQDPLNPNTAGNNASFILKLDSSGTYQWHTIYGSDYFDYGCGITVNGSGSIYVSGWSAGSWNGPLGQSPLHNYSGSGSDVFVLKLDSSGAYQWHTFYGNVFENSNYKIVVDSGGNLYIAGTTTKSWSGPSGQSPLHAFSGVSDLFVLKLNDSGAYQWHTFFGSPWYDYGNDIAVNGRNLYLTGLSQGSWNGPSGQSPLHPYSALDMFVLKLNDNGEYLWHTFYGSTDWDGGASIAVDGDSNIYVAGYSNATWGDPINPHSDSSSDILVLKMADSITSSPQEGTIGTELTISGSGFGDKKGKVLIGGVATKIAKDGWHDDHIICTVTKLPEGPYTDPFDVTIITKSKPPVSIPLEDAFTVRTPRISSYSLTNTEVTVNGVFFGGKKGKVYLVSQTGSIKPKSCKVTYWYMDPTDGTNSQIKFMIPKVEPGSYWLYISNKVGNSPIDVPFQVN